MTQNTLIYYLVNRTQQMGRIQEKLSLILKYDIFETLSKYNELWKCEDEKKNDSLDNARRQLSCISDDLWEIMAILEGENYDLDEL